MPMTYPADGSSVCCPDGGAAADQCSGELARWVELRAAEHIMAK